jgi:hypothetical protein
MREEQSEPAEGLYEGYASKDPEPEYVSDEEGRPKIKLSVEGALRDAYRNAKGSGARAFVVDTTEIYGDNPISDYKVVIKPKP